MADDLAMLIHLWNCALAPSRTSGCRHGDMHPHLCADMGTQELVIKARKEIKDSEDSLIRSEKLVAQAIEVIKGVGVKDLIANSQAAAHGTAGGRALPISGSMAWQGSQ